MANSQLRWNPNALYEVRSSPGVAATVEGVAQRVCDIANSEGKGTYVLGSRQGAKRPQGRWRATVVTADWMAMRNNMRHNTLIRAMGRV